MQITLNQQHLEAAVKAYVAKAGIVFPVEDVNFTAGRGRDGMTATVNVEDPFAAVGNDSDSNTPEPAKASKGPNVSTPQKAEPVKEAKSEPAPKEEPKAEVKDEPKQEAPAFSPDEEEASAAEEPKAEPKAAKASLFS